MTTMTETVIHDLADAPKLWSLLAGEQESQGAGGGWSWVLSDLKSLLETGSRSTAEATRRRSCASGASAVGAYDPDVKRTNIEFLVGWLDALRRHDLETLRSLLDASIVWQGLREEWVCHGPDSVVDMFAGQLGAYGEIEAVELIGGERHAILHARGGDLTAVDDVPLPDGIYNLFAIEDGKVNRIDDYADRSAALSAAGLGDR